MSTIISFTDTIQYEAADGQFYDASVEITMRKINDHKVEFQRYYERRSQPNGSSVTVMSILDDFYYEEPDSTSEASGRFYSGEKAGTKFIIEGTGDYIWVKDKDGLTVPLHFRSLRNATKFAIIPAPQLEPVAPATQQTTTTKRGRPRLYADAEERKRKHREQALRSYYRRKALNAHLNDPESDGEIRFTINTRSKTLGPINEDVTFRRTNGRYRKQ